MNVQPTSPSPVRSRWATTALVAGPVVLAVALWLVRDGRVPELEARAFRAVNGLPAWLYPAMWPLQLVGALALGPLVAVVAWCLHRRRLALGVVLATLLKLGLERLVKLVASRQRPATSLGDEVVRRGDVPIDGESFVSGHAVLVTAVAWLVTAHLPGRWKLAPWLVVAGVLVGRVYVGAHLPLDVVGGAALGLSIGAGVELAVGRGRADPPVPEADHRELRGAVR